MNNTNNNSNSNISFRSKVINLLEQEGSFLSVDKFNSEYLTRYKFNSKTIFDVGVCKGTPELYKAFAKCKIVLIDPLEETKEYYEMYSKKFDMDFIHCAVGSNKGTTEIKTPKDMLALTSVLDRTEFSDIDRESIVRQVEIDTLNEIIKRGKYTSPFGIKIDTEGYELEVIKGMNAVMQDVEFIIAEVSIKKRFKESYFFSEIISYLAKLDFELIDILNNTSKYPRFFDCLFINKNSSRFSSEMFQY